MSARVLTADDVRRVLIRYCEKRGEWVHDHGDLLNIDGDFDPEELAADLNAVLDTKDDGHE